MIFCKYTVPHRISSLPNAYTVSCKVVVDEKTTWSHTEYLFCSHAVIPFLNRTPSPMYSSPFPPLMINDLCLQIAPFVPFPFCFLVDSFILRFPGHGCLALCAWPSIPSRCSMALRRDPTMIVGGKYVRMHISFDHVVPGSVICIIQEIEAMTQTEPARTAFWYRSPRWKWCTNRAANANADKAPMKAPGDGSSMLCAICIAEYHCCSVSALATRLDTWSNYFKLFASLPG